jgi:hypothetical protein
LVAAVAFADSLPAKSTTCSVDTRTPAAAALAFVARLSTVTRNSVWDRLDRAFASVEPTWARGPWGLIREGTGKQKAARLE